jgi:hypothetical protein
MVAHPIKAPEPVPEVNASGLPTSVTRRDDRTGGLTQVLRLRDDYTYREDNWRIGRLVQTKGLQYARFRSRHAWMRQRRRNREKELEGLRLSAKRDAEEDVDKEWLDAARKRVKDANKKPEKKDGPGRRAPTNKKRKFKEQKGMKQQR